MQSDSFFVQGSSHDICEDYCINGSNYCIVSDGCSSSPNTDFGSRILSKVAENNILHFKNGSNPDTGFSNIITESRDFAKQLGMNPYCLDATLMIAISDDNYSDIYVVGDGLVVHGTGDNIYIHDIIYPSGAPRYLNYWYNNERLSGFTSRFGNTRVVNTYEGIDRLSYSSSTSEYWHLSITNNDYLLLLSDGIHSFQNQDNKFISFKTIIKELISFKSYNGVFIKRRLKRFLKTHKDIRNYDDLSMAGIYLK